MGQRQGPLEVVVMLDPNFWRGRRVLVTGQTGFKGSWLTVWLLKLGAEVWGYALAPDQDRSLFKDLKLDKGGWKPDWGHLHHRIGDIRNIQALQELAEDAQPQVVFHLAAQPLVRSSYSDPLGTWSTNVMGCLNLLEALKPLPHPCAVVMVTTDKVYQNREWVHGYRELDRLGGHDPYSASKAAAELAIASWRASFCGNGTNQTKQLRIATARAGNVIGGGDWAVDRIVPDAIRSLATGEPIKVRNPDATRPWQHVLEPLGGYLRLAEALTVDHDPLCEAFNFGPLLSSNKPVRELVESILEHWPGEWIDQTDRAAPHEANLLHLQIDRAHHRLGWQPQWDYSTTLAHTVGWYLKKEEGKPALECCLADLAAYKMNINFPCTFDS